jgi:RNA-binding protein 39
VLVSGLHTRASERDIYEYFMKMGCGKVRDIRIIKDGRTKKSKGLAYVEFYSLESVTAALEPNHLPWVFEGREWPALQVEHSCAEKNRLAESNRLLKAGGPEFVQQPKANFDQISAPARVLVTGLTGPLSDLQDDKLRDLFEPFGKVDILEVNRDEQGRCRGQAVVQYADSQFARLAVERMHRYEIRGQRIKVQQVAREGGSRLRASDLD